MDSRDLALRSPTQWIRPHGPIKSMLPLKHYLGIVWLSQHKLSELLVLSDFIVVPCTLQHELGTRDEFDRDEG